MKRLICFVISVLLVLTTGCGQTKPAEAQTTALHTEDREPAENAPTDLSAPESSEAAEEAEETEETSSSQQNGIMKYYIPEMDATISVPEEYSVFGKDIDYTDEMCYEADVDPAKMAQYLSLSFDQVHIIPHGDSFLSPSIEICVKVKDNKYNGVNLADLSDQEYKTCADALISGFSTDYSTLEKNGLKFVVFDWDGPNGKSYRYATIIDGDMIYVYATVAGAEITQEQRELLESIAASIEHK